MERVLPALWPALGFIGLYLAAGPVRPVRCSFPGSLQALLLAATITATGLSLENGLRGFRLAALAGCARGGWSATAALHAPADLRRRRPLLVRRRSFRDGAVARCIRPVRLPGRLRVGLARIPISPRAIRSDLRYYAAGRCWRSAWCWRGAIWRARLVARLRQRRRRGGQPGCLGGSAALYRPAADLSAAGRDQRRSPCRRARC